MSRKPLWVLGAIVLLAIGATGGYLLAPDPVSTAPTPNAVDVGFAQDMIVHHQQAVTMTQLVRGRVDGQTAELAYGIESDQLMEIGQLQGYLDAWNKPRLPSGPPMGWMPRDGHLAMRMDVPMPGMATQDELNRMQTLSGSAGSTTFLQFMVRHHQGGLPMENYAATHAAMPQVRALAQRMAFTQSDEIQRMATFLRQRGASTLPSPN